jgi:hypothetical protein
MPGRPRQRSGGASPAMARVYLRTFSASALPPGFSLDLVTKQVLR